MSINAVPYFYDRQFRRYITQFMRLFSGFQYAHSADENGVVYRLVPVRYGDPKRDVEALRNENSENRLKTLPMISCYVTGLEMAPDWRTYQEHTDSQQVVEKKYNEQLNRYENEAGDRYTVTKHNPVPYKMQLSVDLVTSNSEQKFQIMEQILVTFNPTLNIHTNANPLDWSNLGYVEMKSINWTNRAIPPGLEDLYDIAQLQFEIPILINPPAKLQRNVAIHTILTNLKTVGQDEPELIRNGIEGFDKYGTVNNYSIITMGQYKVKLETTGDNTAEAIVLNELNGELNSDGDYLTWQQIFETHGDYTPDVSQIRFRLSDDPSDHTKDIVGTFREHTEKNKLIVNLNMDTIPANTVDPFVSAVDPTTSYPGDGTLAPATNGQRYLLLGDIPQNSSVWSNTIANRYDIIYYSQVLNTWIVDFSASNNQETTHYVQNSSTGDRFKWTGTNWVHAVDGTYNAGFWRLYL